MTHTTFCETCLVYIQDDTSCPILDEYRSHLCPCRKCIVKSMCEKPCEEFNKLTRTSKGVKKKGKSYDKSR